LKSISFCVFNINAKADAFQGVVWLSQSYAQ